MTERNINSSIKTALVSNDDFVYAHLIKFERPFDSLDSAYRTNTNRYAYYTDGATDIVYGGNTYRANRILSIGTYSETTQARATSMKLTLAGENISAKITLNGAITVSGSEGTFTPSSTTHNGEILDFVEEGFREGDQIKVTYSSTTKTFVINSFTTNNTVIKFSRTGTDDDDSTLAAVSSTSFTIELDSEELKGITRDRVTSVAGVIASSPDFVNREVTIDKIFIEPETGAIIGNATVTVFKGIIASVDINEALTGSKVNWTLTSHWGDFASIQGRMTTDETHRALDARGAPQPESAHRREYAADLGFLHSETSLSAIANYQTQETRFRMKSKKRGGIAGLTGQKKYWQEEYQTDVQHEVDLNVHLQGKHLPIVYGVQRINGNPIFADTLNNNAKIIYTADAICEGEVHGLFNLYIDDVPLMCTDDNDFDIRSVSGGSDKDNTQLQCYGNMSHGNTMSGERYAGNASTDPQNTLSKADLADVAITNTNQERLVALGPLNNAIAIQGGISPALSTKSAEGLGHDETWSITHPYSISLHFLSGRPNQRAAGMLLEPAISNSRVLGVRVINAGSGYGNSAPSVSFSGGGGSGAQATAVLGTDATDDAGKVRYIRIDDNGSGYTSAPTVTVSGSATAVADLGGYKRQNNYYDGNLPYWSVNHRLLDTAYSAFKFEIDADSTNIPEIEYVMKGKVMECFNYDHTYIPDAALGGSDNAANFSEGDLVTVQYSTDGSNWTTDTTGNFTSGKFKIMDSYLFTSNRAVSFQKFRLDKAPSLLFTDGTPARTRLRLKNDSNQYWHMVTWNHAVVKESDNISFPDHTVAATAGVNGSGELQFSSIDNAEKTKLGDTNGKTFVQFHDPAWYDDSDNTNDGIKGLKYGLLEGTWSTSGSDNILTFSNTNYTGVTFNQSIKLLNAYDLDFTGVSAVESATQNELQQTHSVTSSFGHTNTFTQRGAILTNLTTGEFREIEAFSTGTDIITLDTPFFTPCLPSHKFKIDGKGSDRRASINPTMQTLDYLTVSRYGKGLKLSEIDLSSFLESALLCDTRSDVEMKVTSTSGVTVGDIYQLVNPNNSNAHVASGKVLSVGTDSVGNPIVTFTDVINKFAKEYATRTLLSPGDIVFTEAGNFYRATGTITNPPATVPTHTSGTVLSLEAISSLNINKLSGSGPSTIAMSLNKGHPLEYSLYDSDFVKYWRYVGWERNHQAEVTRHQTNFILDTSKSVFANTNALLSHFNGILSYENGKYVLSVETQETTPTVSLNSSQENVNAFYIEEKDIIGNLKVVDNSQKTGKNTIKASISDPQNNYGSRAVTFFNSTFLEADRGVIKTGTFPYTGITNYYNARIGTEKELVHTRFSKEVSFDIGPRGLLLRAGQVIALSYEAFGWSSKLFRIQNLNFKANCSVSVKCREYDDSIYSITKQRKLKIVSEAAPDFDGKAPGAPLSLTATNNKNGSIVLAWANAEDFIEGSDSTEIFYHTAQDRTAAVLLATVDNATGYTHTSAAAETLYFWVRHRRVVSAVTGNRKDVVRGNYFPASATGGVQGISLSISAGATSIKLLPSSHVIDYSVVGDESSSITFTTDTQGMEGTIFYEFIVGATTKQNTTTSTFTLADSDEPGPTDTPIKVLVKARQGANNGTVLAQDTVSIFAVQDGQSTVTGILTNEAHTVTASSTGTVSNFTGAGGTFKVFYGNTDITSNAKTAFSVSSETGVDVSINSSTGVYTVSSMSADTGTAVFSCEVEGSLVGGIDNQNDVTITKTYTISKAKAGTDGASVTGAAGQANAIVYAYQRSASTLTSNPGAVTVSLTGTTSGTITTGSLANGWSKTIPTGTNPLYVCAATAAGNGSTDTIAANEWSTAVVLAQGQDGVDGTNNSTIFLYKQNNNASAPTSVGSNNGLPEGNTTVTFSDGSVSFTTANGWSTTNPGVSSSNQYLWVTQATAIGAAGAATDIIPQSEWAAIKLFASFGAVGDPGTKTALVYAYKRSASDLSGINISSAGPGAVTVSLVSGLITTGSLANSWSKTPVASDGNPLYICAASAAGIGNTDTIAASEWSAPAKFVEDGTDGSAGDSVALVAIYKQQSYLLALPTITGTSNYNFDTGALTSIPSGWSTTRPTFNFLQAIYESEVAVTGSGTTNTVTWPTAALYSPFFDLSPKIFQRSVNQPATPSTQAANPPSGWSSTIPSGSNPVWQSVGTFIYNTSGNTYSWSAPEKITGDTGSAGINSATIILYKLTTSSSAPAHPNTTLTWNFANKAFTDSSSELDGWSVNAVPAASDSNYIWSCSATAAANTATDDIPESEWSDPGLIRSPKSQRSAKGFIYYDASTTSAQSAPTTSGVSYSFTTTLLSGLASGWSNSRGTFPYTILDFKVTEATHGGTQTITFGVPEFFGDIIDRRREDFALNWDDANNRLQFKIGGTVFDNASYPTGIRNDQLTIPSNVSDLTNDSGFTTFDGNFNNLSNKPTIPTNTNQLTNGAGFTTFDGAYSSLSSLPTLFDGNFNSLSNKPTIPTNTNQLTNGAGFTTFDGAYSSLSSLPTIPAAVSDLTNDSGFLTGITGTLVTNAGGVLVSALNFGDMSFTSGGLCSFISYNNGSSFSSFNATGEISITHPTLGTFSCNYTFTRSGSNINSFALTNTGSGNDAFTSSSFGSAAANKVITVTHTASSKTITCTATVSVLNFGSGGSGGGGGGCFISGTKVALLGGKEKQIQDLEIEEYVLTENKELAKVLNKGSIKVDSYYYINQELGLTPGHPIWVEDKGWACIDPGEYYKECKLLNHVIDLEPAELEIGDKTTNGTVDIINKIDEEQEVWWITVDNTHTYYVNKMLVHNGAKP